MQVNGCVIAGVAAGSSRRDGGEFLCNTGVGRPPTLHLSPSPPPLPPAPSPQLLPPPPSPQPPLPPAPSPQAPLRTLTFPPPNFFPQLVVQEGKKKKGWKRGRKLGGRRKEGCDRKSRCCALLKCVNEMNVESRRRTCQAFRHEGQMCMAGL